MSNLGRRRVNRVSLNSPIQVCWQDALGNPKCFQAIAIDISDDGIRFQLPEAVTESITVQMRSEPLGLTCAGRVRTCSRAGNRFEIGIEFTGKSRFDRFATGIEQPPSRLAAGKYGRT